MISCSKNLETKSYVMDLYYVFQVQWQNYLLYGWMKLKPMNIKLNRLSMARTVPILR